MEKKDVELAEVYKRVIPLRSTDVYKFLSRQTTERKKVDSLLKAFIAYHKECEKANKKLGQALDKVQKLL